MILRYKQEEGFSTIFSKKSRTTNEEDLDYLNRLRQLTIETDESADELAETLSEDVTESILESGEGSDSSKETQEKNTNYTRYIKYLPTFVY